MYSIMWTQLPWLEKYYLSFSAEVLNLGFTDPLGVYKQISGESQTQMGEKLQIDFH